MRYDSLMCVTWPIHVCDMTHSCVWHDVRERLGDIPHSQSAWVSDMTHSYVWHNPCICVTCLRRTPLWRTTTRATTWATCRVYSNICAMTNSDVWHDWFARVTWRIHVRDLSQENAVVTYHNPLDNVGDLARIFYDRCLLMNVTPYVVTKKTVFKWQEGFWRVPNLSTV